MTSTVRWQGTSAADVLRGAAPLLAGRSSHRMGRRIAFMEKSFGDAFEIDLAAGKTRLAVIHHGA